MVQNLIKQAIEHNNSKEELSTWFASLSDSEKVQLRGEMQDLMIEVTERFRALGEVISDGFGFLSKWVDENSDFINRIVHGEP